MVADSSTPTLPSGTYRFVSVPPYGSSHWVVVTVVNGRVTAWGELSQDGTYRTVATPADLECGQETMLDRLEGEIETARRLRGLGHSQVQFVAAGEVAA